MIRAVIGVVAAAIVVVATASLSPTSAQIWVDTGLDLDTTGNEAQSLGPAQSCVSVAVGDVFPIDFWVRGVPPRTPSGEGAIGGVAGFSYNLHFDPAILRITEVNNDFMLISEGESIPFPVIDGDATGDVDPDPLPATTGNLRVDFADISTANAESGSGILSRLTLEAIGPGTSELTLQDDLQENYPAPNILDSRGYPHFVNAVQNARVIVGDPCEVQPTPLSVADVAPTFPGGFTPPPTLRPGETVSAVVEALATATPPPGGPGASPRTPGPTPEADTTFVGIDVIPEDNDAESFGELDVCAAADVGDVFSVDLVISDVEDLLAWESAISYDASVIRIVERDVNFFLEATEGSQVIDTSAQTPDDSGQYTAGAVDSADPLSPESGSGVLVRLAFEAIAEGVATISGQPVDLNADDKSDRGIFLRNAEGDIIGDENDDTIFDGVVVDAEVRVGDECSDSDARVVEADVDLPDPTDAPSNGNGDDDDGGTSPLWIILAIGAVVVAIAGAAGLFLTRGRGKPAA